LSPFEPYVLSDLYSWLAAHSGISHPYVTTPTSTIVVNSVLKDDDSLDPDI